MVVIRLGHTRHRTGHKTHPDPNSRVLRTVESVDSPLHPFALVMDERVRVSHGTIPTQPPCMRTVTRPTQMRTFITSSTFRCGINVSSVRAHASYMLGAARAGVARGDQSRAYPPSTLPNLVSSLRLVSFDSAAAPSMPNRSSARMHYVSLSSSAEGASHALPPSRR